MSHTDLEQTYPQISRSVAHLNESEETSLKRLAELLRRHGKGVIDVMEKTLGSRAADEFEPDTLPRMFGKIRRESFSAESAVSTVSVIEQPEPELIELVFSLNGTKLMINGEINITAKATRGLLFALAKEHLRGAGKGLDFEDYPALSAYELMDRLGLADDETVRRRISRSRNELRKTFDSAGYGADQADELIETLYRNGYRFTPERVNVRIKT